MSGECLGEAAVGRPAVTHHDAGVLGRDHLAGLVIAAPVGDPVGRRRWRRGRPQPGALAPHSPADSSGTIIGESFTALTIESCTGTRSVEVDCAAWQSAPDLR